MREVVLQLNNDVDFEKIKMLLAPLCKEITMLSALPKFWDGSMDWLGKPYIVDSFKPLTRDEIYDR
jgi:hypothetical protein